MSKTRCTERTLCDYTSIVCVHIYYVEEFELNLNSSWRRNGEFSLHCAIAKAIETRNPISITVAPGNQIIRPGSCYGNSLIRLLSSYLHGLCSNSSALKAAGTAQGSVLAPNFIAFTLTIRI